MYLAGIWLIETTGCVCVEVAIKNLMLIPEDLAEKILNKFLLFFS